MTWPPHQITWHATSQLTTVAHPTSPHNHPHSFISPRKQLHDIRAGHITTMEQQKARSQQRNGLGIALVGRLAHILYRQILSLLYSFFLLKLPPPSRPGTICILSNRHKHIYNMIFYFLFIQYNVWIASCRTRPQCCFSRAPNPFEGDSDPKNPYICGTCDLHSEKLLFFWSRVFVNLEVLHDASSICRY